MDEVIGGVKDHLYLLEHDHLLPLHLGNVELRVDEYIGQEVYGAGEVLVEHLGKEAGILPACEGVQDTSDGLYLLRDVQGCPFSCTLEEHVLDEMGNAVKASGLISGARDDPDADRRGLDVR